MSQAAGCPARDPRRVEAPRRPIGEVRAPAIQPVAPPVAPAPVEQAGAPVLGEVAAEVFRDTFDLVRRLQPLQTLGIEEVGRGALLWLGCDCMRMTPGTRRGWLRFVPAFEAMDTLLHLLTERLVGGGRCARGA
ncbi:MAG: hypothetical protein U0359_19040 [Byssovorax sp.]